LNAAVEAARAGETGAGFAVVAEEVRNLAMRSAEAAKNTESMIADSTKKIQQASELFEEVNGELSNNRHIAKKVTDLVGEIAAASGEQSQCIELINKAVHEMDKVVQENAASSEDFASASEEMNAQAEQMKGYVYDLTALVGGKQNGVVVDSRSEPSNKQYKTLVHAKKERMLPVPNRRVEAKTLIPHKGKVVRSDQIIPMEEGQFKDF